MKNIKGLFLQSANTIKYSENMERTVNFIPRHDQLLIKMAYAPINPSDYYFYRDVYYDKKPFPAIPGFEGVGCILEAGSLENKELIGKHCSFVTRNSLYGTYCSHVICDTSSIILLDTKPDSSTFEFLINPLTAISLLEKAKSLNAESFIQNGGSTSVGRLILYFNKNEKMKSVSIVRNNKHSEELKNLGADEVLNQMDDDFSIKLKQTISKYKPKVAFDSLAGKSTGTLFNALSSESKQIIYGSLELKKCEGIDPSQLIFTDKSIEGFHLFRYLKNKRLEQYGGLIGQMLTEFRPKREISMFNLENYELAFKEFERREKKIIFKYD